MVGLSALIKKEYYQKLFATVEKNGWFIMLVGMMSLVIGMALITYHSKWTSGMESLISIIGWITLVKGIMTLMFPDWMIKLTKNVIDENGVVVMGVFGSVLGLLLMYFGFML